MDAMLITLRINRETNSPLENNRAGRKKDTAFAE